jgi:hypothetical protein
VKNISDISYELLKREGINGLVMSEDFNVEYNGELAKVSEHMLGSNRIFRIVFSSRTAPLVVTMTKGPDSTFWTSIPEGRLSEAKQIGALILEHFKKGR